MKILFSLSQPIPNMASAMATGAFVYVLVAIVWFAAKRVAKTPPLGSVLLLATYWWLGTVGMALKLYLLAKNDVEVSADVVFGIFVTSIISAAFAIIVGVNIMLDSSIREDEEKSIRHNYREEAFA
ncbi:hypothetical protein HG440_003135 [Candidatus Saccharibacteria bacterium]|nr:hypothetical protein [Candidatus Saccharibacteria bacterium]